MFGIGLKVGGFNYLFCLMMECVIFKLLYIDDVDGIDVVFVGDEKIVECVYVMMDKVKVVEV